MPPTWLLVTLRAGSSLGPSEGPPSPFTSVAIWLTSVLVGQMRPTAVDLLWASGMHLDEAAGELDGAVRSASERRNTGGSAGIPA